MEPGCKGASSIAAKCAHEDSGPAASSIPLVVQHDALGGTGLIYTLGGHELVVLVNHLI